MSASERRIRHTYGRVDDAKRATFNYSETLTAMRLLERVRARMEAQPTTPTICAVASGVENLTMDFARTVNRMRMLMLRDAPGMRDLPASVLARAEEMAIDTIVWGAIPSWLNARAMADVVLMRLRMEGRL